MAQESTLVTGGQPSAAIFWWGDGASPVLPFATSELQGYLRTISGATLPIRDESIDPPAPGTSGIVIASGVAGQGAIELPAEAVVLVEQHLHAGPGERFVIRTIGEQIVLTGTNERSVLYAAYRFLEHLGLRFFAPAFPFCQGQAEHVPSRESVQVAPLDIAEAASFRHRRKYVEEGWSHTPQTLVQLLDWMAKHRQNVLVYPYDYEALGVVTWDTWREQLMPELAKRGIIVQVGGHGYQSFLPPSRYQASHPEWFPDPDEPVTDGIGIGPANVFDAGNEAALQAYTDNVIAYLLARPEIGIFEAWPPDSARWPSRVVERFGSVANAQAHVTRALSAALPERGPGVAVEVLSYIPATDPPDREHMYDDATIVDIAPFDRSYAEPLFESRNPVNRYYDRLLTTWRNSGFRGDMGIYEYYRKYSWRSLPVLLPRLIGEEIPYYLAQGAVGLGTYSEPGDWLTYELTHNLVAALWWDAGLDADDYVDTWLRDRFGAAAGEMREYVDLMEEAGRLSFDRVRGNYDSPEVVTTVRDAYLRASEILTAAMERADSQAAFIIERLGWNLRFAIADTEIDYCRLKGDRAKQADASQRAQALIDAHGLDGIILQCTVLLRRYEPDLTREDSLFIYDRYRGVW